jgi:hypothetical protein
VEEPRNEATMETIDEVQMYFINLTISIQKTQTIIIQETQVTSIQKVQVEIHKIVNCNLKPQQFGNMLLLSFLARKIKGIELILDYNKSHVVQ